MTRKAAPELRELFDPETQAPSEKLLGRIAKELAPRKTMQQRAEEALDLVVNAYINVYTTYYAPSDDPDGGVLLPYVELRWEAKDDECEVIFWPYAGGIPTQTDEAVRDIGLDEGLTKFFEVLYIVAPKDVRVKAPPHTACTHGQFIVHGKDPMAVFKTLRLLIEEEEFSTRDDYADFLPQKDTTGTEIVTNTDQKLVAGKVLPAFTNAAELADFRASCYRDVVYDGVKDEDVEYKDGSEEEADFVQNLPMRPFLSRGDALNSSCLVKTAVVLPFNCDQLEYEVTRLLDPKAAKKSPQGFAWN